MGGTATGGLRSFPWQPPTRPRGQLAGLCRFHEVSALMWIVNDCASLVRPKNNLPKKKLERYSPDVFEMSFVGAIASGNCHPSGEQGMTYLRNV